MTEWEKNKLGYLYNANYDDEIIKLRNKCIDLCYQFNNIKPSDYALQKEILHKILGKIKGEIVISAPFYCDYGFNIEVGENFYTNHNCTILDAAKVTFGNNVFIGPNCVITTAGHPLDKDQRKEGLEFAYPITIKDDVWIGANVTILPGITIGEGSIIGAGSVVTKDIPSGVIAVGNPCKVMRNVTDEDKNKYKMFNN